MNRQDKATTERHARTLRELVKQPDNKLCADCKRNDPRWASWNIGVFLCIRCSGIHRGMGTHISRVKSIDLDSWSTEQMESIKKWGNRRANLYWEAYLKPGHSPPDHKLEAFIRSKYDSRRWAQDGPPPQDPSVLEAQHKVSSQNLPVETPSSTTQSSKSLAPLAHAHTEHQHTSAALRSNYELLSTSSGLSGTTSAEQAINPSDSGSTRDDLFSLDFSMPSTGQPRHEVTNQVHSPAKDVKQDILSLFSNATRAPGSGTRTSVSNIHPSPSNNIGNVWSGSTANNVPPSEIWSWNASNNPWQADHSAQPTLTDSEIWNMGNRMENQGSTNPFSLQQMHSPVPDKKNDAFGDIWSQFR